MKRTIYYDTIDEYIDKIKHYKIPYSVRVEVYLLRLLKDPEKFLYFDERNLNKIKETYPDFKLDQLEKIIDKYQNEDFESFYKSEDEKKFNQIIIQLKKEDKINKVKEKIMVELNHEGQYQNGKIKDYHIEIGYLYECYYCGNVYDGCAQCNCGEHIL